MEIKDPIENKTIFVFWTGTNEMSFRRIDCLNALKSQTGCHIELITVDNLHKYIKVEDPLHPAYPYLSETHKCDYLRTYFMRHYGGGYSDIKIPNGSWVRAFEEMQENPEIWINGYHESCAESIACPEVNYLWRQLPGNCCYIVRPNTYFVREWYDRQKMLLDERLDALRENPSHATDCCREFYPDTKYPIGWNEMLGRIFHKVAAKYTDRILFSLPLPNFDYYR
jgi:Capsular polysaccharide synthesis protein